MMIFSFGLAQIEIVVGPPVIEQSNKIRNAGEVNSVDIVNLTLADFLWFNR